MQRLMAFMLASLCACRTWSSVPPTDIYGDHAFVVADEAACELDDAETRGAYVTGTAVRAWHIRSCKFDDDDPNEIARQCGGEAFEPADRSLVLDAHDIQYAQIRHVRVGAIVVGVLGVITLASVGLVLAAGQGVHK